MIIILSFKFTFSQSSPPLLLDDTGTPGPGKWEINIMTTFEHAPKNEEWQVPLLDINYGLGKRGQVTLDLPYSINRDQDFKTHYGFNGIEVGLKYRFLEGIFCSDFSTAPNYYYSYGDGHTSELYLPLEWHSEWPHIGLTAEVGHIWTQGYSSGWEAGIGVALYLKKCEILGEFHSVIEGNSLDLKEPMINLGLLWEYSQMTSFFFSWGKSVYNRVDETNLWSLVGIQLLF